MILQFICFPSKLIFEHILIITIHENPDSLHFIDFKTYWSFLELFLLEGSLGGIQGKERMQALEQKVGKKLETGAYSK